MVEQPKPRKWGRYVLVASLALNVGFLGLLGGALLRDKVSGRPPSGIELGFGPIGKALTKEDRREIGRTVRDRVDRGRDGRPSPRRMIREIQEIVRADPFDQDALREVFERASRQANEVQSTAQQALLDRISRMTVEERAAFADGLDEVMRRRQPDRRD